MSGALTAVLAARRIIAPGIADLVFTMRTPSRLQFSAGQFISIAVGESPAAGDPIPRRSYSIASQSDAGEELRFIIRVIPEGTASGFLMSLPLGAVVNMTGPHGFFVLDAAHAGDVVFGATGTGIAAVLPMLGELARRSEPGQRRVYWGVRQESDLFSLDEVKALASRAGARLSIHLTAPPDAWTGPRGRISPAILEQLPSLKTPTFYLVGNGAMITELKR